jgi:hypothetical protein
VSTSWADDPFFDQGTPESIDGGTTSAGLLWHAVSPRWGHSMHTMCSYQGMFPAKLANYFIQSYSAPGDLVLDPFSGRGTTVLQARASGRQGVASDLSPLAYVLSAAKANPPSWKDLTKTIDRLERDYAKRTTPDPDVSPDIEMLFHPDTLRQLWFLRRWLLRTNYVTWDPCKLMIGGSLAGILHGSFRTNGTSAYLSISMPNTFSMAPTYVRKYVAENGLVAPDQNVFARLREKVARLYLDSTSGLSGTVHLDDAVRSVGRNDLRGKVQLAVTSPPYLKVMNYGTSNWIRLWWLGLDDVSRQRGAGRLALDAELDHQHQYGPYKEFILKVLRGIRDALAPTGIVAFVVGDVATPDRPSLALARQLWDDIGDQTGLHFVDLIEDDLPSHNKVSRIWGDTRGQATDRDCVLVLSRQPNVKNPPQFEVDWSEPCKDAGPDEAHEILRASRPPTQRALRLAR